MELGAPESTASHVAHVVNQLQCSEDFGYRIKRYIADGGFGFILKAVHVETDCPVAIKIGMKSSPHGLAREAAFLMRLAGQPRITPLLDYSPGEIEYLVLPFYRYELFQWLDENPIEHSFHHLATELLAAFEAIHSMNIVFQDVSPHNVMFRSRRWHEKVVLIDFGLAVDHDTNMKGSRCGLLGTDWYSNKAANECRKQGPKDDMESVCLMLWQLEVGYVESPWRYDFVAMAEKDWNDLGRKTPNKFIQRALHYCRCLPMQNKLDYSLLSLFLSRFVQPSTFEQNPFVEEEPCFDHLHERIRESWTDEHRRYMTQWTQLWQTHEINSAPINV